MTQLQGMSRDPRKLAMARSFASDMLNVTAEDIQALAQRYLRPETRWTAIVLPNGVAAPDLPALRAPPQDPAPRVAAAQGEAAAQAN